MNLISEQFNEKPSTNYDVRVMPIEVFETEQILIFKLLLQNDFREILLTCLKIF